MGNNHPKDRKSPYSPGLNLHGNHNSNGPQENNFQRSHSMPEPNGQTNTNGRQSMRRSLRRAKKKKHEFSYDMRRISTDPRSAPPEAPVLDSADTLFLPEYSVDTQITEKQFEVKEVIAKGAFGNVLRVLRSSDDYPFAMKVMKKNNVVEEGAIKQCKDEASIQASVGSHPFVVEPYWFFQNREFVFIVMEYIPRGELFSFWKQFDMFSEDLVKIYAIELAMVLDYLHHSGIIYRDLKMENILIDSEGHLKVIDFGLAKWLKKGQRTNTICGTLQYIAPEILSLRAYGHSSDWWSLGILMYTLLTGSYPVRGADNHIQMRYMIEGHMYELPDDTYYTPECRDCIILLLQKLPHMRICQMKTFRRHPFFRGVSLDALFHRHFSPNQLILELEANHRQMALNRTASLGDMLDESLIHYQDMRFAWNQSVASLNAVDV